MNHESFFIVLSKFMKEYRKISFKAIEEYEFTPGEIDVLMFLFNNTSLDTAKDISKFKGISKSLVSRSVDSLLEKKLISATPDEQDKRIVHLMLTGNASDIVEKLKISRELFSQKVTEGISENDLKTFVTVIQQMLENVNHMKEEEMHGVAIL